MFEIILQYYIKKICMLIQIHTLHTLQRFMHTMLYIHLYVSMLILSLSVS